MGSLTINKYSIPVIQSVMYFWVNCHLKWDVQIKQLVGKIRGFFSPLKHKAPRDVVLWTDKVIINTWHDRLGRNRYFNTFGRCPKVHCKILLGKCLT